MPLENRTFSLLDEQATKRGVSVQELLRAVIVPEWLRMRSHVVNGEAAPPYRRTLAYKLSSLEKAFQDLKSEVERGALADQGEGTLVRPVKLIRSVDQNVRKNSCFKPPLRDRKGGRQTFCNQCG